MDLGKRVRQRRAYLRLSQDDLAHRAQMAQTVISRIERGMNQNPGADVLKRLAIALNCSVDWLLEMYDERAEDADPHWLALVYAPP